MYASASGGILLAMSELPPCGLYRTTEAIGEVPAGVLVYFHNHGDPGPGVYVPERWVANRAIWSPRGVTLPDRWDHRALQSLPAEGFYRVRNAFHCCAKRCVEFKPDMLVQLGYNGAAKPLVFLPQIGGTGLTVPERGTPIDDAGLKHLVSLAVSEPAQEEIRMQRGIVIH